MLLPIYAIGQTHAVIAGNTSLINLDSSFLIVKGTLLINTNSPIKNNGNIELTNDWINNSGTEGFTTNSNGKVTFNGLNQSIDGSSSTSFYRLKLENDTKTALQTIKIKDSFNLMNTILETNDNQIILSNPNNEALIWENSFITSSSIEGYFIRSTNSTNTYPFPVGNNMLENQMRVVELTPTSSDSSSFGVALSITSPSNETGISAAGSTAPFPVENKAIDVKAINTSFYHRIHQFFGNNQVNTKIYFQQSDDHNEITYRSLANWNSTDNEWQNNDFTISTTDSIITPYNIPTAIAISNTPINNIDDIYALNGINLIFPNSFTPNSDGFNDLFEIEYLSEEYPENEITIYNRWGEIVYKAAPYLNDWDGTSTSKGLKLMGNTLPEDTYFYTLTLGPNSPIIKKYIELIRD
ncbi:MAG: gliding motility-associated C-terminal domain-containing protein [Flavobacteriales bacterium]|jgi:gliding motility-associated-like protein|nr:gliding motility-associated C-terminal domain-containing protein [Flavobacteriales bacterium]